MAARDITEATSTVGNDLADKVEEAISAIREILVEQPNDLWTIRSLQDAARERSGHSSTVVALAFWQLKDEGDLSVASDFAVRPAALA